MRVCAYKNCGLEFEPKTYNQRYHDPECCRLATNERLMEEYYARKARRLGKRRVCSTLGCNTKLSRYNESTICQRCAAARETEEKASLLESILGVSR